MSDDKDLVEWEKHWANPILTEALHGEVKMFDWRDPFVFQAGDGAVFPRVAAGLDLVTALRGRNSRGTRLPTAGKMPAARQTDTDIGNPKVQHLQCKFNARLKRHGLAESKWPVFVGEKPLSRPDSKWHRICTGRIIW